MSAPAVTATTDQVLDLLRGCGVLLEGHILLSSGLDSPVCLQCARLPMDPARAAAAELGVPPAAPAQLELPPYAPDRVPPELAARPVVKPCSRPMAGA